MKLQEDSTDLPTSTGPMRVHLYRPQIERGVPALLLYSEIYQQTGPIQRAARRFAGHGFAVAVPEVFHAHEPPGTVLPYSQQGTDQGNRYKYDTALADYDADARTVQAFVAAQSWCNGRIGAVGFCLGGHLALRAALLPGVLAAACFYATDVHGDTLGRGRTSDTLARLGEIRGELVLVWGRQDPHVPDEGRDAIRAAIRQANVNHSWHEFNAVHAFMRDEGPRYDPALTDLGYALALETFARVLST